MINIFSEIILSIILVIYWIISYKNWFINDILSIKLNFKEISLESNTRSSKKVKKNVLPNIIDYKVLHNTTMSNPAIIIAVLSSPHNYRKRYSFRYLSKSYCNKYNKCRFIFFIGYSLYSNFELLNKEISTYNDIVQFSFQNSYINLTILSILAIKYCYIHFRYIKFYVKTDDDMVINYKLLFNLLNKIKHDEKYVYGRLHNRFIPSGYAIGALIIVTLSSLTKIYNYTQHKQNYYWVEDVNLGLICKQCNIDINPIPYNINILIKAKQCGLNSKILAIENYNKKDEFYCLNKKIISRYIKRNG